MWDRSQIRLFRSKHGFMRIRPIDFNNAIIILSKGNSRGISDQSIRHMVATEQMHAVLQRGKQDESTEEDSNSLLKSNSSESRSSSSRGGDAHRHAVSFEGATEPRTRSPAKRRHVTAKYSDAYKDVMGEDGLAMLLKACEILDSSPTKHGDSLTGYVCNFDD